MENRDNPLLLSSKASKICAAEFLAATVLTLFPTAELIGGESTDLGFFYDFAFEQKLDDQMVKLIEQELLSLVKSNPPVKSLSMMPQNASDFLNHHRLPFRAEAIQNNEESIVELFQIDQFIDLCPTPHIAEAQELGVIKLLASEEATVRLPETGLKSVTRISGVVFPNSQVLKRFLKSYEAAKKRDHRLLGKELELYFCDPLLGTGSWNWLPKGQALRDTLSSLLQKALKDQPFQRVTTSRLLAPSLLKKSGIGKFFNGLQKLESEGIEYSVSPDGSIAHASLFSQQPHQAEQLPIRYTELVQGYNSLRDSQLSGMLRSRTYTADEGTIFCSPRQVMEELISSLHFINKTIRMFGFEIRWTLRTKRSRHAGTEEQWKQSSRWLSEALAVVLEKGDADAEQRNGLESDAVASWGPKVDFCLIDALGREWVGPSLGFNLLLPERLGLRYQDEGGQQTPWMVTRSLFGSLERFTAILVEHYAGNFPLWLAPEQVRVLSVKENNRKYAQQVCQQLAEQGIRASVDMRRETISEKVFAAEKNRIPYMVIVGNSEESNEMITVRRCQSHDNRGSVPLSQFLKHLQQEITGENCGDRKTI